jgi:hypothetical protein
LTDNNEFTVRSPISLQFIVGGGAFLTFDYRVVGGPDHGRRVELLPKYADPRALEYGASVYNGPAEEYRRDYVDCRPCHREPHDGLGALHPDTIAVIMSTIGDVR